MAMFAKALVADDDPDMRKWFRAVLRPLFASIYDVSSGSDLLLSIAERGPFDLIVTDVRMPMPNGMSIVAMTRAAGVRTPFMVVTAMTDNWLQHSAAKLQDVVLLSKPLSVGRFVSQACVLLSVPGSVVVRETGERMLGKDSI